LLDFRGHFAAGERGGRKKGREKEKKERYRMDGRKHPPPPPR